MAELLSARFQTTVCIDGAKYSLIIVSRGALVYGVLVVPSKDADTVLRRLNGEAETELQQVALRLGCIARVSAQHDTHACPADDCLECWPEDVIDEFRKFAGEYTDG